MASDVDFPAVLRDRLKESGWKLADESVETRFQLPCLTVRGATCLFHDAVTREESVNTWTST